MQPNPNGFTIHETHGILLRPGVTIHAGSEGRGWSSLYASHQAENPFERRLDPVDDQLIVLHLDGPVQVHRRVPKGEASRVIPPGGLFMVPGGMDFGVRLDGTLQTLHLYLRRALIEEVAGSLSAGDPAQTEILPRFGEGDPLMEQLLLAVRDVLHDDEEQETLYIDYLTRALAARMIRAHAAAARPRAHPSKPMRHSLTRAIDFMAANLDQSLDLVSIAGAAGLSPSHLARQFRASFGKPPHQHLMHMRIDRAKRLLDQSDNSIAEIAFACGFSSQEHLTRLFKRSRGISPAAYRKARRT